MRREVLDFINSSFLKFLLKGYKRFYYLLNKGKMDFILENLMLIEKGEFPSFIKDFQRGMIFNICEYAYWNSNYYYSLFQNKSLSFKNKGQVMRNFKKIPLLSRDDVRNNETLIKSNYLLNSEVLTGGSTGEPLRIFLSSDVPIIDDLHQMYYLMYIGYESGDEIASFGGVMVPENLVRKNIFWVNSGSELPFGRKYSSFYFRGSNRKIFWDNLILVKPSILRGYPSVIFDLAKYVEENHFEVPFLVKGVILTSEQIFDWQIEKIKEVFNTKVYLQYGHSECAIFAYSLRGSYRYICSPFYGYTEVLDDRGRHVKTGELGEVVVTSFFNRSMPLIRYKTGDMAVYGGSKNGVVFLEKLEGRKQDYLLDSLGRRVPITALIFGLHYKAFRHIKKWQVVQNKPGEVVMRVIKDKLYSVVDENEIREFFYKYGNIKISFDYVKNIELTRRGKFRFVIQNCLE